MPDSGLTDSEWTARVDDVERNVLAAPSAEYPIPDTHTVEFTKTIDHTLLKLDATAPQFDALCSEARTHRFATVCVRPEHVARCVAQLADTDIRVASVIGFHEGTYETAHKIRETTLSLSTGATELDIVLNYPLLLAGRFAAVYAELAALRQRVDAVPPAALLKLILETSQLDDRHVVAACVLASAAGFDYVKTSTGFCGSGAQEGDVRLMRACCEFLASRGGAATPEKKMEVKASGGVRSLADARRMLAAGASRLGTSAGVAIAGQAKGEGVKEGEKGGNGY